MTNEEIALELIKIKYENCTYDNLTYYQEQLVKSYKKILKELKDE